MKKFTKTLLGAVLSVAMVVTGGLAALGNKPVVTKAAETTVSTSYLAEQVVTSEGATAVIGKRATANTSFSANQHTGLVLTGGTGATFNLGTIDITSSYWNVAEGASKYFALAESAMPFITWNYIVADASVAYELSSLIIRVKDHNDPTNYFEVWTSPYTVGANNPTKMYARASNQAKWGDKRINKGMYTYNSATNYGANQRNRSLAEVSTLFGSVDASLNYGTASTGVWLNGSKVPFALVYDTEEKAVYTNITYNSATNDMKDGFIIRDFSEEDYGDGQALLGDDPWTGFSSNYVDVEVVFETVENAETTSIVIKQFGGKSLNAGEVTVTDSDYVASMPEVVESANKGETITLTAPSISCAFDSTWYQGAYVKILKDGSLVDTVTFDAETKSYTFTTGGNYVLEYYGANDALIGSKNVNVVAVSVPKQLSASEGASFAFGSAFPSNGANNKQPGLILTGGTGSTFNLGTINLANTGWESASYFDAPTAAVPFISYNYMDANVSSIKIRLYDHYDHTKYIDTWVLTAATETRMYAQGSGQTMQGAYRHTQGFKQYPYAVVTKSAIRNTVTPILNANYPGTSGLGLIRYTTGNTTVKPDGTTYAPYGLFFNYEQNALYSSVTYNSTTNNLATSYVIRDFDEPVYEDGIAASGDTLWEKFSTTLVDVEVVLETLVDGAESASVVVRELGGSALSKFLAGGDAYQWTEPLDPTTQASLDFEEFDKANYGDTKNLLDYAGMRIADTTIFYTYEGSDIAKFSVNGGEKLTNFNYTFTTAGTNVIKFFDANDNELGETTVEVKASFFSLTNNITNGSIQVIRDGEEIEITNEAFLMEGDVIKLTPTSHSISEVFFSDVREFSLNGTAYNYDTANKSNNANLPLEYSEDGYYFLTVTEGIVADGNINVTANFNRYCKVTTIDSEAGNTDAYYWTDEAFWLQSSNSDNINKGKSANKVLVGYGRKDVVEKQEDGTFRHLRDDYKQSDYNQITNAIYGGNIYYGNYSNTEGTVSKDNKNYNDTIYSIVPDMVFEAIYLDITVDYEFKLISRNSKESGLRVKVIFGKEGIDNYLKYNVDTQSNTYANPFETIHNYITTVGQLTKGGSGKAVADIKASDWKGIGGDWDGYDYNNKVYVPNALGLENGIDLTSGSFNLHREDFAGPGYVYQQINGSIWANSLTNEDQYGYAIMLGNFKSSNGNIKEYVFMPVVRTRNTVNEGIYTMTIVKATSVNATELAAQKLESVLTTEKPEGAYNTINDGTTTYYTRYTLKDINWISQIVDGVEEKFSAGEAPVIE